ncbi:Retrovirus-related Pol Polyprotein [Phytophthora palmivora]|uniref:Retrovirus-related Pol Polyprotein n=1 Tax=Phytophthora palmivora TaxID=4796 RepID=A0A2P4X8Q3_9STRA|nr:Retrovirus-related Pol Polyprotein [Phytophthora palmivora]
MDIASGYWNVPMAAGSVIGLYEWFVMPFGLCNGVPAFKTLMENVLVDSKWRTCLVYLDDCVVFSEDFPTHLTRLKEVLNPEKVKAVMNVKRPDDVQTVRVFLGLASYFRCYIPGYATISALIERLKAKDAPFSWNDDCESAFIQLKRKLVEPSILVYTDFNKWFKLYVDSSKCAVGSCLMQTIDGCERAIAHASKLLIGYEKNWIHKRDGTSKIESFGLLASFVVTWIVVSLIFALITRL